MSRLDILALASVFVTVIYLIVGTIRAKAHEGAASINASVRRQQDLDG